MKRFVSNMQDVYMRITAETATHYICGKMIFSKSDIVDIHPMDELMPGKFIVHVVPFY